ncbi:MAG: ABC transporter ATP-binding protein [Elusimicrobia bacterium]|nr:ABC transporter ATP-binding protein [Elusimicrobiota bacterium]
MTIVSVDRVGFAYPKSNGDRPFVLEDVSFELKEGELLGVLGPNGAGKSTLLRLLIKALVPREGRIVVGGSPLADLDQMDVARRAAWVPQELDSLFVLTVEEMVRLGRFCRTGAWGRLGHEDRRQVERALAETDLLPLRHRPVSRLSGGERRRVLLARALAQEPAVLLLDEPTAHLDPGHQADLVAVVDRLRRERGLAVIAILHDVSLAMAWCPTVLLLKDGRTFAQGPAAQVITPNTLRSVYGLGAVIHAPAPGQPGAVQFCHPTKERNSQ